MRACVGGCVPTEQDGRVPEYYAELRNKPVALMVIQRWRVEKKNLVGEREGEIERDKEIEREREGGGGRERERERERPYAPLLFIAQ
jgi:hypothetical protein